MSKADIIFEELRYEKRETDEVIIYKQYNLILSNRTIMIFKKTKAVIIKDEDKSECFITFEELDAINKKIKEMSDIDE